MKLRLSITTKLTLVFVLFAALLLGSVGALAYTSGRAALESAIISGLLSTATEKEAALNAWVEEREVGLTTLANLPTLREMVLTFSGAKDPALIETAHDRLVQELQSRVGLEQQYVSFLLIDPKTGRVTAATDPVDEGKIKTDEPFFINGRQDLYVQNVYYALASQDLAMTIAAPIRSTKGELLAVLAGQLNLDKMAAIISRRTGLSQTDEAFLVNSSSSFVTPPRFISDPVVLRGGIHDQVIKRCLAPDSGVVLAEDYRGVPGIAVYRWLPQRQLCLIVKIDQAEALAPSHTFGQTILLIGTLALLVASLLALGLARTITQPVRVLQAGAVRFGRGELNARLPETSGDELGRLACEFNTMAVSLSEKEAQLHRYAEELEQIVGERTAALRLSEERFAKAFRASPAALSITRLADGCFVDVNESFLPLFGYSREELIGHRSTEFNMYPNPDERAELLHLLSEQGMVREYEMTTQTKSAEIRDVLLSTEIIELDSEAHILAILFDITDRKQAEAEVCKLNAELEQRVIERTTQLEAANKELETFAYSVSHDLRVPLRGIDGFSQALLEDYADKLDAEGQRYLQRVRAASQHMAELIDDLLALSQITRSEMYRETVNLSELAQTVAERLRQLEPERQVKFVIAAELVVQADGRLLRAALENLLGNAWKFTGKCPQACIEFGTMRQEGQTVYFVRDNGAGFDMAYADKLFGAFQRLHSRVEFPGTGIGLATVQRIIHRHGGLIWAEGAVEQGATFSFTL